MLLKDLQTLATKLATGTLFHVEKAGKAYSVDYSALAKAIIEEYADSTVGGSKQSVQAAIGALNSSLGGWKIVRHRTSAAMPSAGEYIIPYPNGEGYSTVYGILAATIINGGYCLPFPPLTTSDSPSFNNSYAISMRITQAGIAIYTGGGWGAESRTIDFFLICKV